MSLVVDTSLLEQLLVGEDGQLEQLVVEEGALLEQLVVKDLGLKYDQMRQPDLKQLLVGVVV